MAMAAMDGEGALFKQMRRMRRNWLALFVVTMLAALALVEWRSPYVVVALWLAAILAILFVAPSNVIKKDEKKPKVEAQPQGAVDQGLIAGVRAGIAVLDTPVFILDQDAGVLFENAAAERAFGTLPVGSHISGRLRSPGLLDVIRETIATVSRTRWSIPSACHPNASSLSASRLPTCRGRRVRPSISSPLATSPICVGSTACAAISSPMPAMS